MAADLCPVWAGYLLASPLRKLFQNPDKILGPYVSTGMTVLEVGPGMGFFSLPMARMVGSAGRVVCVDLQQGMLDRLVRRAVRAGLGDRIQPRLTRADRLGVDDLAGTADFALIFAVLHEVPDPAGLLAEVAATLKPGGLALLSEPAGHVGPAAFESAVALAMGRGFLVKARPVIRGGRSALLARK